MRSVLALACCLAALLVTGCAGTKPPPLPPGCTGDPTPIRQALRAAPGPVRLPDGTRLSECLANANDDGELQMAGAALTRVADDLAAEGDALALGYLVGAAERGAGRTNGVALELAHRIEVSARRLDEATSDAALSRGLAAGRRTG